LKAKVPETTFGIGVSRKITLKPKFIPKSAAKTDLSNK
jgi:hypothetical protein